MSLFAELVDKKKILLYKPKRSFMYSLKSEYVTSENADDIYIDRLNRLYIIRESKIYAIRHSHILIAEDIFEYAVIPTDYGCAFFWIQKNKETIGREKFPDFEYVLVSKDIKDNVEPLVYLSGLKHSFYKILIENRHLYVLYYLNIIDVVFKERRYTTNFEFEIKKICYAKDCLYILDHDHNVQIFCLKEFKLEKGFKSLGQVIDINSSSFISLIAIATVNGIFSIDIKKKTIIKTMPIDKIPSCFERIYFVDKRTLVLVGKDVFEYNLMTSEINESVKGSFDSIKKYFYHSQGYDIETSFKEKKFCNCNCYQNILDMKIEFRRSIFELNEKIEQLSSKLEEFKPLDKKD